MRIHLDRRICVEDVGFPHSQPNWNMVGGFAHDFRNFIHIIGGTADLMKRRTQDARMLKHCEVIMDVCRMATDLVDDMVSLSRDNEDDFREININDEVRRWTALMTRTVPGSIKLERELSGSLPSVSGKVSQMAQVIINLVKNSAEAMNGQGKICIKTGTIRLSESDCSLYADARPGDFVTLTVSDTGPGISPQLISKIFAPLFSTKRKGGNAGLGLTMARNIIKKHQGWIDVKSRVGQGTSFVVYLPVAPVCRS